MKSWAYVATCLVVPQVWAIVLVRVFEARARRRERKARLQEPAKDFTI